MARKENKEIFTLASAAKPHIADGGKDIVQAEILYKLSRTLWSNLHVGGVNRGCQVQKLRVHIQTREVNDRARIAPLPSEPI